MATGFLCQRSSRGLATNPILRAIARAIGTKTSDSTSATANGDAIDLVSSRTDGYHLGRRPMVARPWLAGPPPELLQPALEAHERPETMAGVDAALLMVIDELLDGSALQIWLRRRRRSEQRVANVLPQLSSKPGVEGNAEAGLRAAVDVRWNEIRERLAKDRFRLSAVELEVVRQRRGVLGQGGIEQRAARFERVRH